MKIIQIIFKMSDPTPQKRNLISVTRNNSLNLLKEIMDIYFDNLVKPLTLSAKRKCTVTHISFK
jgi:hypothetical protein